MVSAGPIVGARRRLSVQLGIRVAVAGAAGLAGLFVREEFPPFAAAGVTFSGRFSLAVPLLLVFLVAGVWSIARDQGEPHRLRHAWGLVAVYLVLYGAVWSRVRELNIGLLTLGSLVRSSKIRFGGISSVIVWGSVASAVGCATVALVNGVIMAWGRRARG